MRSLLAAAIVLAASGSVALAQDAARGEKVFNECRPCHQIGDGAQNLLGPELNGLDGRHSGSVPGYPYSDANKNSGIVWNQATFKGYIENPQAKVPGTKMYFAGIKDPRQIADLWAYLSQFNADGSIKKQ